MNIKNQIIELAERHKLRERALKGIDIVLNASIESDIKDGIDFLEGIDRNDLIYEFDRYEFHVESNENFRIVTRINIYTRKLYGPNFNIPIGHYDEYSSVEGEYIDDFLTLDLSPIKFNISHYIEKINKLIPKKYFKRNIPEYEFATYINNTISLFQGFDYEGTSIFIKRSLDYIDKKGINRLQKDYLKVCIEYLKDIFLFIESEKLVDIDKLNDYRIRERIITKS